MSTLEKIKRIKFIKFMRVNLRRFLRKRKKIIPTSGVIILSTMLFGIVSLIAQNVFAESPETLLTTTTNVLESVTKPVITELVEETTVTTTATTTATVATITTTTIAEEVYYEPESYEEPEIYLEESDIYVEEIIDSTASSDFIYEGSKLTASIGCNEGPSGTEKWYNKNMSLVIEFMITETGIQKEFWIREDGVKMYGEYVMCAANLNIRPKGTILETSLGTAMVCDRCEAADFDTDLIDIAVDWYY